MKPDFDYSIVPYNFTHCLNGQYPRATECLRHQVALHAPADCKTFMTINPKYAEAVKDRCPNFLADRTVQLKCGMTHMYDKLPHESAVAIRRNLVQTLGKTLYYRIWRKERLVDRDTQKYILQLFRKQGINTEPLYDETIEGYDWE